jgi:hypothetical protein
MILYRAIQATLPDVHIMNVMIGENQEADKANRKGIAQMEDLLNIQNVQFALFSSEFSFGCV